MREGIIKPKEGLRVINPENMKPIPPIGIRTMVTSYWQRRINEGDVIFTPKGESINKKGK